MARKLKEPAQAAKNPRRLTLERVDAVLTMLCDGTYVPGQTDRELAARWAHSSSRVRNIVAEASRTLARYSRESPEVGKEYLARALLNLERVRAKAEALGTAHGFAIALQADDLILTYLEMRPAKKVDVIENGFGSWTDEELKSFVDTGKRPPHKWPGATIR